MLSTITTVPTFYYMPPILLIIVVHFKWHRWGSTEQSRCPNWKRKKQMENRATRTQSDPVIFPISSALRDRKRIQTWRRYIKNLVWPIFSNMFVNDYEYMCAHAPSPALNSLSFKTWVTFAGVSMKRHLLWGNSEIKFILSKHPIPQHHTAHQSIWLYHPALIAPLHMIPQIWLLRLKNSQRPYVAGG